jgi:hypothetical protein
VNHAREALRKEECMSADRSVKQRALMYVAFAATSNLLGGLIVFSIPETGDGLGDALNHASILIVSALIGFIFPFLSILVVITNRKAFSGKVVILASSSFVFPLVSFVLLLIFSSFSGCL